MAILFKQLNSAQEMADYLNDIVLSKQLSMPVLGLHGKTLILGATTVTFADASGAGLSPAQIVTQINAAVAGAASARNYGHAQSPGPQAQVAIVKATTVVQNTGTANSILGFSTTAAVTVGANAVAKADIIAITSDAMGARFTVVHE